MESTFCCLSDSDRLEVPRNETTLPSILDANIPIISRVGTKRTYIHTLVLSVYVGRMCYAFWSYIPLLVNPLFLLSGLRIRYLGHLYSSLKALMKNPLYICFFWGGNMAIQRVFLCCGADFILVLPSSRYIQLLHQQACFCPIEICFRQTDT